MRFLAPVVAGMVAMLLGLACVSSLVASSLLALTGWGFRASLFANPALFAVLFAGSVAVFRKAVRHYAAQRDALPQ